MNDLRPTLSPFTQEDPCLVAAPTHPRTPPPAREDLNIESDSGVITRNPRHRWPSMTPPEWLGLGRRPLCSPLPPSHKTSNTKQEIDTNTNDLEPAPGQISQAPSNRRGVVHHPALPVSRHEERRRHETTRFAKCAVLKVKKTQLESHLRAQELAFRAQSTGFYESQVKAHQEITELKQALKRLTSRIIDFVLAGGKALGPESALDDQRIAGAGRKFISEWVAELYIVGWGEERESSPELEYGAGSGAKVSP